MISCREIEQYYSYTRDHPNKVSEEVHLLIKNVVLPTLESDNVIFDKKTYDNCIKFCEKWFYPLFPYQKFMYAFVFMYEKNNPDVVVFSDIFQLMGRGNGKDGMLIPLALFLTTPMYGVKNYHIDIVATSEEQAINTFNVAYNMLEENEEIMKRMFYWTKTEIVNIKTKSKMRYNTSSAKTKDGKQSGMVIFNELHAYEDHKQIDVYTSGLGKVKHARVWTITTNGHFREGPFDKKVDAAVQILNGQPNLTGMFPFLARIKDLKDVHLPMKKVMDKLKNNEETGLKDVDFTVWNKANPSLEYMPVLQDRIYKDYIKMAVTEPTSKTEFFAKRMNMPMRNEEVAVTSWENVLRASYDDIELKTERYTPDLTNRTAVVGVDFASINDFVSVGLLFKIGKEYVWRQKTWINSNGRFFNEIKFPFENKGQEGFQDFEVVDTVTISEDVVVKWIYENMSYYNIKKIVLDNYRFSLLKKGFESYGLEVESRENPDAMVRMIRHNQSIYGIVAPYIERLFVQGNLNIGNSAMMRWSINNTGMKQLKSGNFTYFKIEEKLRKNDAFMAMVHAFSVKELLEEEAIFVYM